MGDSLSTLRTRFLDEVDDPNQTVSTATNARITRMLNEGCRHAAHVIQRRDHRFPQGDWPIQGRTDVERYPLPDDFAEDYAVYRSDLVGKPRLNRVSLKEWNAYRYSKNYLLTGAVNDIDNGVLVADVVPSALDVYYIERPWIGLLPVPNDNTRTWVLSYRQTLRDLSDDSDETPIPSGDGTDVICIYAAVGFLSRRGHDVSALAARLQAAEERLKANFGASAASSPVMQDARP